MNLAGADPRGSAPIPTPYFRKKRQITYSVERLGYKLYKQAKLGSVAKDSSFVSVCMTHQRIDRLSFWFEVTNGQLQLFRWSTQFLSHGTYWEETLALFDQNYRKILDNWPNFALLNGSKKWMSFSFRGLRRPDPLSRGSAPGPRWGLRPGSGTLGIVLWELRCDGRHRNVGGNGEVAPVSLILIQSCMMKAWTQNV